MQVKLSPEIKAMMRAGGYSEEEIKTAEVKMTQSRNLVPSDTPPEGWTEEDVQRWNEKVDSSELLPLDKA